MLLWDRIREYDMDHRKKKIGILTFQRAVNYGASLQMYALQKMVKELGAEAEIIDYDCPRISDCYQAFPLRALVHPRLFWHAVLNYKEQSHRNQKFDQFEKKHMTFSEKLDKKALSQVADRYDAYIVGSDQVWNPLITGGDSAYFLDFVKDRQKKFAYAASFGVSSWPVGYPSAGEMLEDFRAISTREKTGAGIVRTVTEKTPPLSVSVDPVFLPGRAIWQHFVKPATGQKPYLFIYVVGSGKQEEVYRTAAELAKEKHLEIINLRYGKPLRHKEFSVGHLAYEAGPDEFVSYIANAECVVTDSFHATAFSTIFHKDMYVSKPEKVSSRITDLFDVAGIAGRFIGEKMQPIDWDSVDERLKKAKADSLRYLKEIIEG